MPSPTMLAPLTALVRLVLPVDCPGCGTPDVLVCPHCRRCLAGPVFAASRDGPPGWAAARYEGPVSRIVVAWKDGGRLDLTAVLAPPLTRALAHAVGGARVSGALDRREVPLVVPVPSARSAVRRRGQDVVRELAVRAVRGLPDDGRGRPAATVLAALTPVRRPQDQTGLGVDARRANVSGAYAVRRRPLAAVNALTAVRGRPVVVVDDVVTTGASLQEAARALTAAGARVVAVATVCATPRRFGGSPDGPGPGLAGRRAGTSSAERTTRPLARGLSALPVLD